MHRPSTFPKIKPPKSIFNHIEAEVSERTKQGQTIHAMHVGDTWFKLPEPMGQPVAGEDELYGSMINRYGDTFGDAPLRKMLLDKLKNKNKLPVEDIDSVQITCGATAGLQACFSRLLEPGAELLVISPYWTILRQVADQAQVQIVEVPLFDRLADNPDFDIAAELEKIGGPWCKGIYLNTPSNPTGMILNQKQLEQIADFARKRDLWVFSDEAYEDFIFDESEHISIGALPGMFERTISVYTFSKNFGTSGLRVGYIAGTPSVIAELNRAVVGGYYHAGRYDQRMAWRGLRQFDKCINPLKDSYQKSWQWVKENLTARTLPVSGGFYFFVYLGDEWKNVPSEHKINRMLDSGIVLSPGESFGLEYQGWARMCFSILPLDQLQDAVGKINALTS